MDKLSVAKVNQMNSQVLAFVGDAEFSLFVRTRLVAAHDFKSGELTKMASRYVRAVSQSAMLEAISQLLTVEESDIVKRGRNCHTNTKAKNAGLMDYKRATGLESLLGFLYLTGQAERLLQLEELCVKAIDDGVARVGK